MRANHTDWCDYDDAKCAEALRRKLGREPSLKEVTSYQKSLAERASAPSLAKPAHRTP